MPAIAPASKVLVSGANGYIATWVVRKLLEHGYAVRGTVRTETKGAFLLDMFKSYADKLELVVVEDIARVCTTLQLSCRQPLIMAAGMIS